jgi:hypothetical protein
MNTSDKFLLHTIDAATRKAGGSNGASWGGTLLVLAGVGVVIAFLLWAEDKWGWVQ